MKESARSQFAVAKELLTTGIPPSPPESIDKGALKDEVAEDPFISSLRRSYT
jgi:hypothetical protein